MWHTAWTGIYTSAFGTSAYNCDNTFPKRANDLWERISDIALYSGRSQKGTEGFENHGLFHGADDCTGFWG